MRKDELLTKPEAFLKEAEQRSIHFLQNTSMELPSLLTEEVVTNILIPYTKGGKQHVIPISAGVVTAKVHNLKNAENECEEGCILIIPDGSPTFAPFYDKGVGIIFLKGGSITHGAILARESKIPAVSLGGQNIHLQDGMIVTMDGEQGILEIQ
jgi:phosphohistidine swiveling domain-containing protein